MSWPKAKRTQVAIELAIARHSKQIEHLHHLHAYLETHEGEEFANELAGILLKTLGKETVVRRKKVRHNRLEAGYTSPDTGYTTPPTIC